MSIKTITSFRIRYNICPDVVSNNSKDMSTICDIMGSLHMISSTVCASRRAPWYNVSFVYIYIYICFLSQSVHLEGGCNIIQYIVGVWFFSSAVCAWHYIYRVWIYVFHSTVCVLRLSVWSLVEVFGHTIYSLYVFLPQSIQVGLFRDTIICNSLRPSDAKIRQ